jgi:hypothetical protein
MARHSRHRGSTVWHFSIAQACCFAVDKESGSPRSRKMVIAGWTVVPNRPHGWDGRWQAGCCRIILVFLGFAGLTVIAGQLDAQERNQGATPEPGTIVGTVTDVNGNGVDGATVVLQGPAALNMFTVTTNEDGFFEIHGVRAAIPYLVTVRAKGFVDWNSPVVTLKPGQWYLLTGIKLQIQEVHTTVTVSPQTMEQIAVQQVKTEELQRGFGIIPNFLEVYDPHPAPLTWKLKFHLAFRIARDPVTITGASLLAGANEIGGRPRYSDGIKGFAERFGASYGNQFTDTMIGDALLPSLFHQDPRYFYQGTGTTKSRLLHAISNVFVTRGDNGRPEANYSLLGGDLASAAIANAYYPNSDRGIGVVFENFAINVGVHVSGRLLQEFVFRAPTQQASQKQKP